MVKQIVHDPFFLGQKSEKATKDDISVAMDLLDTLAADRAAKELSEYGMLPTDIPAYLCRIFAEKGL